MLSPTVQGKERGGCKYNNKNRKINHFFNSPLFFLNTLLQKRFQMEKTFLSPVGVDDALKYTKEKRC